MIPEAQRAAIRAFHVGGQQQVQALIEDYNAYVCPVPAAKPIIASQLNDPTVANSPTVFPNAQQVQLSKPYFQFQNSDQIKQWNDTFQPIYGA